MCCIELFLKVNRFVLFSGVDEISSLRVQGAQAYSTAQRYLTLNSHEKHVKKNAHMRAIFSNAQKTHEKEAYWYVKSGLLFHTLFNFELSCSIFLNLKCESKSTTKRNHFSLIWNFERFIIIKIEPNSAHRQHGAVVDSNKSGEERLLKFSWRSSSHNAWKILACGMLSVVN